MPSHVLYHNPGCSKSRRALEILREHGVAVQVIEYLEQPLDRESFERLLGLLPNAPADLVRRDAKFSALGLDAAALETRDAVVALLLEHPALMQRPIFATDDRAVIARPPERVLDLL